MHAEPAVSDIVSHLFVGDPATAQAVFNRYSERLVRLAEKHLSRRLAGRVDGEDIVQSVFRTFFRRGADGEFRLDGSAQLWQLLVRITVLKARAKARHHTADKRDAAVERPIADAFDPAANEPGPEDAVILIDQIDAILRDLPPVYGQVLGLRLQGRNVTDVADELNLSRQTIHRALNLLQERLTAMETAS
jgi:RNA polymerase sigma-70 factor, ECF subfamily